MNNSSSSSSSRLMPLRPAIKAHSAPNSPMTEQDRSKFVGRRVNFPADDMLVTGYLEPPNPWEKALNSSADEVTAAYRTACEKHKIKPLNNVLQQLRRVNSGEREEILSLKGQRLEPRHYDAIEEIFKRIQFTTIDVESTNLDDEASVALFDMIEYYESAKHLNISYNRAMTARGWQACARMLKKTHCLESLNAQNTCLNEHFMSMLCRTLRCGSSLTKLHLENCNMSGRTCTVLMTALKLNTTLKQLYLAENKLTPTDALHIGNLFRANTKLEVLDLRNNPIQDAGVAHIVDGLNDQALGAAGGLKTLNLMSNQLTFHSCSHLAKAVANTKTLEVLNIGSNNITNEGIFHLREPLMKNRTLHQLSLKASRITCEGAVALAEYIADNPCIQHLELYENNIKIAGLLALSLSMKVNQSLTRLDLDKDYKKESGKEIQEQHQHLLLEIMEYCERNLKMYQEQQKRIQEMEAVEPTEKLSDSVCRLLSLWDNPLTTVQHAIDSKDVNTNARGVQISSMKSHEMYGRFSTNQVAASSAVSSSPTQSPPRIVLPEAAVVTRPSIAVTAKPKFTSTVVNPALLTPPPPHPSPPKSRFRVSRVTLDSDALPSSAGHTPMPSPVPSPGHTPMPSPGCTPIPSPSSTPSSSPVPSPVGSPVSSPCRAHGVLAPPPSPIRYRKGLSKPTFLKQVCDRNPYFSTPIASPNPVLPQLLPIKTPSVSMNSSSLPSPISTVLTGNYAPPSSPNDLVLDDESEYRAMPLRSKSVTFCLDEDETVENKCFSSNNNEVLRLQTGTEAPPNTPAASTSCSDISSLDLFRSEYGSEPGLSSPSRAVSWTDSLSSNDMLPHLSDVSTPSCMSDVCSNTSDEYSRSIITSTVQTSASDNDWPVRKIHRRNNGDNSSKEASPSVRCLSNSDIWKDYLNQIYAVRSEMSSTTSLTHTCSPSFTESDSFVSIDSGLASPDSELSGHQSPISLSSHSENGDFLCSLENINQLVPDSCTQGLLAPPPTPVDAVASSDTYQSKQPETEIVIHVTEIAGQSSDTATQDTRLIETITTEKPGLLVSCTNQKAEVKNYDLKEIGMDSSKILGSEASLLHLQSEGPVRSISDSNLDKRLVGFDAFNNFPSQSVNIKHSTNKSADCLLSSVAASDRYRTITLAEPSCVRLFGGGVPSSAKQPKDFSSNALCSGIHLATVSQDNSLKNYAAHMSSSLTDDEKMARSISALRNHNNMSKGFSISEEINVADNPVSSFSQSADNYKPTSTINKQESSSTIHESTGQEISKREKEDVPKFHDSTDDVEKLQLALTPSSTKNVSSASNENLLIAASSYTTVNSPNILNNYMQLNKFDMHEYEMCTAFREPSDSEIVTTSDDYKASYIDSCTTGFQKHEKLDDFDAGKSAVSNLQLPEEMNKPLRIYDGNDSKPSKFCFDSESSPNEQFVCADDQEFKTFNIEQTNSSFTLANQHERSSEPIYANISVYCHNTVEPLSKNASVNIIGNLTTDEIQNQNVDELETDIIGEKSPLTLTKQKAIRENMETDVSDMTKESSEKSKNLTDCNKVDSMSYPITNQECDHNEENAASPSYSSSVHILSNTSNNKIFRSVTVDILADEKDGKTQVSNSDSEKHESNTSTLTKPDRSNFYRRASTGSYLSKKSGTCRKRCINMIVDEFIQQQLIELYNSAKNRKANEPFKRSEVEFMTSESGLGECNQENGNMIAGVNMACRCTEIDDEVYDSSSNATGTEKSNHVAKAAGNDQNDIADSCEIASKMPSAEETDKPTSSFDKTILTAADIKISNVADNNTGEELNSSARQNKAERFDTLEIQHIPQDVKLYNNFRVDESDDVHTVTCSQLPDNISAIQCSQTVHTPIAGLSNDTSLIKTSEETFQISGSPVPAVDQPVSNSPSVLQKILVGNELLEVVNSPLVLSTNIVANESFVDNMCHNIPSNASTNSAANGFSLNLCILEDADTAYTNFAGGISVTNQDPTPPESLRT